MCSRLTLPDDPLVALALRLTDGESIDWKAESDSGSVDLSLLQTLKQIEAVARAHEGVDTANQGDVSSSPVAGPFWGHLEIIELIGSGSYGDVYRARDTRLGRDVALKLLRAQDAIESDSTSLVREGHLLSRVRHANVVTVHGADCLNDQTGLWMELIEGETLEQEVRRRGAFQAEEVAEIGAVLCDALEAVHSAGLLHRDVKAQNVMRERAGRLVLMDFGSGHDAQRFAASTVEGTPLYAAPEVLNGSAASVQSDIYSLGVLLWYLLTGNYPVNGRSVDEIRRAHALGRTAKLQDATAAGAVAIIAVECLASDARKRPRTASELGRRLRECSQQPTSRRRSVRNWTALGIFAAAVLLLATVPLQISCRARTNSRGTADELVWSLIDSGAFPSGAPSSDGRYVACYAPTMFVGVCDITTGIVERIATTEERRVFSQPLISPDGRRVAYHALANEEATIFDRSTSTSKTLKLSRSLRLRIIAWRPSGKSLLIALSPSIGELGTSVALLEIDTGTITTLKYFDTSLAGVALSHDGRRLAFTQQGDLYIADLVSGETRGIAGASDIHTSALSWTPNDDGVLFITSTPTYFSSELRLLRLVDASGGKAQVLRHSGFGGLSLHGVSETGSVFYTSARPSITLYIAPFTTVTHEIGDPTAVAELATRLSIDWSPDSSAIAYGRLAKTPTIVIHNVETAVERQVELPPDSPWEPRVGAIRWSKQGQLLADTFYHHYLVDLERTAVSRIETPSCFAGTGFPGFPGASSYSLEWTPDGSTMLCASRGAVSGFNAATGAPTESHILPDIITSRVEVSPQRRLVASSKPLGGKFELDVAALDGSIPRTVLVSNRECRPVGWWDRAVFLACSDNSLQPNSTSLFYLLDLATKTTKALTVNLQGIEHVRVRPDGRAIAIATRTQSGTFVLKVPGR